MPHQPRDASSNLRDERPTFVSHLECSDTGQRYDADQPHGLSEAGKPLLVRYDLPQIAKRVDRDALAARPPDLWRYRELLPVRHAGDIVSLGEPMTPLVPLTGLARRAGARELFIKDESRLPTASFKARGMALATTMARAFGVRRVALPTNGNAGAALAAYTARADMEALIYCPKDTPEVNVREINAQGARVQRVDGLIDECGRLVSEAVSQSGWFNVSTQKEPYRLEGKKTMGLELAEQLGWRLPDVVFFPTGGGTGLIGLWKAFSELAAVGWVDDRLPRMVAVQAGGCAPIVQAFDRGADHAERWHDAHTIAAGIRVPVALGDFLMLRAIRESRGFAIAVSDDEILAARERVAAGEGLLLCPEGAATVSAYLQSLDRGLVDADERAVLFNTASGLKYPLPPV